MLYFSAFVQAITFIFIIMSGVVINTWCDSDLDPFNPRVVLARADRHIQHIGEKTCSYASCN